MDKPTFHLVSLSGGKDSTAMLLRMLKEQMPIDMIVFCDTGMEFSAMYRHLDKLESYIGRPITRIKSEYSFKHLLLEYMPKRKNPALFGKKGFSWPGPQSRWCTAMLKTRQINRLVRRLSKNYKVVEYVGIAADERHRMKGKNYPLVDWGMSESDCLAYCKVRGFDWDGLYDLFPRVSCWCCPLQGLDELRCLRKQFPELWSELRELDRLTWRRYRDDFTVEQLEVRFAFEEELLAAGQPIKGRAFFSALRQRFQEYGV